MLNLAKILLPVDFSERSIAAAHYAGVLACRFGSEVVMLHVVPPNEYPMSGFEAAIQFQDWRTERVAEARRKLDSFMADEFGRIPVRRVVEEGDPAMRITELAHFDTANLIVMPTHGYGPFRRFILGSVTAKVLHDADCAVLTGVHIEEAPAPQAVAFRNILCAIDLGQQSQTALQWAAEMAAKFDSRLHVLHVLPALDPAQTPYFDQDWRDRLEDSAQEEMNQILTAMNVNADVVIDRGDVPRVVRAVAESMKADLVVIGRHVSSGVIGRLRAHSYAIVRESPCPVVSV